MKKVVGQHKRAGRRRRRRKTVVIFVSLALLLLQMSTMTVQHRQVYCGPTAQELVTARNAYAVNGDNGWGHIYLERYPEHSDYITGRDAIP